MIFFALISAFSFIAKENPVAVVGNTKVFERDIPANLTLDQHLQNLVLFEVAKEKGYDDSVKTQTEQRFNQEVVRRTQGRFVGVVSKPTLYECAFSYINSKKKLELQLIQTRKFTQALKAYIEVLEGEDFGDVSAKYSFNPELKRSKGLLGRPLYWSFVFPRGFSLIFNMKEGGISPPLKYGATWNVFKIISIKMADSTNVLDRHKMMEEIMNPRFKNMISREKRSPYMFRLQKFLPWIADVKVNSKGLSLLTKRISALKTAKGSPFKEEDWDVVLARGTVGEYTIRDFSEDALDVGDLSVFANSDAVASFVRENMLDRTMVAMCRRLGTHREPTLSKAYNDRIKNATMDFFRRKEILPIIKENEDDLKTFYESNKDKYKVRERRRVSLIEVKEEEKAIEVRERLLKGESFEALAREFSTIKTSLGGGDIGYLQENQRGSVGREAFLLQKGEISKVFKSSRGWAVIKVTDIKKSYFSGYEDVKFSVRNDYREDKVREIRNKIFDQNKEKFGIKVLN